MTSWLKRAVLLFGVFWVSITIAAEFPTLPSPFRYVNDYTHILSANEQQYLEQKLVQYSRETSSQIAVVIVPTTGDDEIAEYAFNLGEQWGIGRRQLNNGVLMLIAKNDRKIFIATGQGLEGALPDAFLSQIIRQVITPNFKQGQYAQGINSALDYIIAASKGEYQAQVDEEQDWERYIPFIMVVIFILFVLFGEISFRRPYVSPTTNHVLEQVVRQSTLNRRRGGGNDGFGGFGGGSSGGGFGGGSFGGGGAGGSW